MFCSVFLFVQLRGMVVVVRPFSADLVAFLMTVALLVVLAALLTLALALFVW
jgi:hypothetical protein